MRELILEKLRSDGVAAMFHEDAGEGFFFIYNQDGNKVLQQVQLYSRPTVPQIQEDDVDLFWSQNEETAGVAIWGRMRAIVDLRRKEDEVCLLETPDSPTIQTPVGLFPEYLDRKSFLEARKRYWKAALIQSHPDLQIQDRPTSLLETRFLIAALDSHGERAAVFEDEGETGYLYAYSVSTGTVEAHVHVYDHNKGLSIVKDSVDVLWSTDESKCAVKIWGELRGIIDLRMKKEGRAWLESRDTPGIKDKEWLRGFEEM
jgi:hypothetical protein